MTQTLELFTITPCKLSGQDAIELSGFLHDCAIPKLREYFVSRCLEPERDFTVDFSGVLKIAPQVFRFLEDVAQKIYRLHGKLILVNLPEVFKEGFSAIAASHPNIVIIDEAEESDAVYVMTGLRCF